MDPGRGPGPFGGKTGGLTSGGDGKAYLERRDRGPALARSYWTVRMTMSLELARSLRDHLGIASGVVPVIAAGDDRIAIFPFLGGADTRVLAAHVRARGSRVRGESDLAITLTTSPLVGDLRLDAAAVDAAVGTCWKALERLKEPGSHVQFVPDDSRRRQVVDPLLASGVAAATADFRELTRFEGPLAEVLAPLMR